MGLTDRYRSIADMPDALPLFPLRGAILLPRASLTLNVFEPRYLALVDRALSGDRSIGGGQPAPDAGNAESPAGKTCPLSGIFVPKQSPNIAPKTLEKLRELLIEERARHLHQAVELQNDADLLVTEREQGDTQFDEESGEGDTISVERERDLMLSGNARQAVDEIDRALERMDKGTYGVCVPAGRRINVARLEAIPWAEFCVDCKQRVERPRR